MAFLTLSIMSLIALTVAQNQTVSIFLPGTDMQSLVGSIVGGDATATTYVIECASGASSALAALTAAAATTDGAAAATTDGAAATTGLGDDDFGDDDSDECGYPVPVTVVEGPSSVAYVLAVGDNTISANCVLSGSSVAVCTESATGTLFTQNSLPTVETNTLSGAAFTYMPVVITAGSVGKTASTPTTTTASTIGTAKGGSTTSTGTQTQTGSTTGASTQASGAAMHMGPAMGMGAAGALAAVAAVVL